MQTASHFVQLTGFLAIIASAGLVLTRLLSWRFATSRNAVRLGLELLGCFSLAYLFATPALSLIALDGVSAGFMEAASVLWWLTLAFTLDASIKRFIWSGPRQAPK